MRAKNVLVSFLSIFVLFMSSCFNDDNVEQKDIENKETEPVFYNIHYSLNNENASLENTTQIVEYGKEFVLQVPVFDSEEFKFLGWYNSDNCKFENGVYHYNFDLYLTAKWESLWTPFY